MSLFSYFFDNPIWEGFVFLLTGSWFLWLPVILGYILWNIWHSYIQLQFLKGIRWILLEVKIPRDVVKSPKAMESVLSALHTPPKASWLEKHWKGLLKPWYSLEIVSINGQVHFFIYTQEFFRNLVESQIYAQYPDMEIVEVPDYAMAANFENLNEWNLWGAEFGLSKDDPYPIRTYVDYGLEGGDAEEAQKMVDPLVSLVEFAGSLKEGENLWFQVLVSGSNDDWIDEGKKIMEDLSGKPAKEGEEKKQPSKADQNAIEAIAKSTSKPGFKAGLRIIYLARRDRFNPVNIASTFGALNQFKSVNLNSFKPSRTVSGGFFFKERRESRNKKTMLDAYRKRSFFHLPYKRDPFILNTEELATIYHFPGRVSETPTFGRVEAKKSEPPSNLPI